LSSASTLKDVVAICAASFHLAALTSDGKVVCCGEGVPAPVDLGPAELSVAEPNITLRYWQMVKLYVGVIMSSVNASFPSR
jgi:hypothetical protein